MKPTPFNINDYVQVKLTDTGRAIHRQRHDDFVAKISRLGGKPDYAYTPPKEDEQGWSRWQMWELISKFGPHIHLGCEPPFETTILIELDKSEL